MNEIDQERLENLYNALAVQMRALDDANNKKDYLSYEMFSVFFPLRQDFSFIKNRPPP